MKKWIAAAAIALAGCTPDQGPTLAQREVRDIGYSLDQANRQATECSANIERSPDFERLSDRFVLRNPPMSILTDKRKPTEADVPVLLAIHKMVAACRAQNLQMFGLAHPAYAAGLATTFREADIEFAALVRRDITWGEYGEFLLKRATRYNQRFQEANNKVKETLNSSHAQEMRERESAQRAFASWAAAQRANLPVTTTCNYGAGMVTCQTF